MKDRWTKSHLRLYRRKLNILQNKQLSMSLAGDRHFCIVHKHALLMTLQEMTLPSIIQCLTSRRLREIAVGYNYELICDTYFKCVEQGVTFPLSFVIVIVWPTVQSLVKCGSCHFIFRLLQVVLPLFSWKRIVNLNNQSGSQYLME